VYKKIIAAAGDELLSNISSETIKAGRERRAAKPHAANTFLKALRRFYTWASDPHEGALVNTNPMISVKLLEGNNPDGFHTWTDDEIARFEKRWPLGTRQRLALDLLLYTGLRRGDVVRLGRQHINNGVIMLRMEKGRGPDDVVYPPVLPVLKHTIAATKTGDLAFLVTERGTPFTKESFGNWFRKACRAAGVPGAAHGLRKAGATRAADNGATIHQLMAIFGWKTEKMPLHYTRKADRKHLARSAVELLSPENRPHLVFGEGRRAKKHPKSVR
jgi:integrase